MWGENHYFCLYPLYQHATFCPLVLKYTPACTNSTTALTWWGRTCANLAPPICFGCWICWYHEAHLPSSARSSGIRQRCVSKMVNDSKPGQVEGVTAYQTCLSCCPSLGLPSDLLKEGECHKVATNMSKKNNLSVSTFGFGWISPESSGY